MEYWRIEEKKDRRSTTYYSIAPVLQYSNFEGV
jgi:hypothetical protein